MSAHISFEGDYHNTSLSNQELDEAFKQNPSAYVYLQDQNMTSLQLCLRTPEQGRKIAQEIMRAMDKLEEAIDQQ